MLAWLLLPGAGSFSVPPYLSDESRQHWQQAFDINFATSSAVVLNVNRLAWDHPDINQTLAMRAIS